MNISEQAKLANKIDKDSLESYRLPNWMIDFVPKQSILNSAQAIQETRGHLAMLEKITADGEFSSADKRFMQDHLVHQSPVTRNMHADAEFRMKYKNELNEYAEILRHAYDNAKQANGIANRDDYINKVLNAPDDNLALRDSLLKKLLETPRALELMDMLGIDRPSG
ncbi:MAG: hypothetical protein C0613_15095 [Desulfobulbaceae bacterium]|nr:MAG: hypothetical protein C0613_15095 [Desulfobulbaceae bacterium]